ncbi:hypothetical protein [Brevibacterium samyangense]|uniref:DUF5642 domain-containing protein n=1 Tax=Brevibacterium samyangense TaxID=366888 RepID=A0ABN2TMS4_9MICO
MNRRPPFRVTARTAVTTTAFVCVGVVLSGCGLLGGNGDVVPGGGAGSDFSPTTAEAHPGSESPAAPGPTASDSDTTGANPAPEAPTGTTGSGASADPASAGPGNRDSDAGGDGSAPLNADALDRAISAAGLSPIAREDVAAAIADPALPKVEPTACRLSPLELLTGGDAIVAMGSREDGGAALVASVGTEASASAVVDRVRTVVNACPTSTLTNSEGTRDLTFEALEVDVPGADAVAAVTSTSTLRDGGDAGAGGGASGSGGSGEDSASTTETVVNVYAAVGSTVVSASSGPANGSVSGDTNGSAEDPAAVTIARDLVPHL